MSSNPEDPAKPDEPFYLQYQNIYAVPILHYNMEMAAHTRQAFLHLKPTCVAVELAETMQLQLLHAASRLPDISVVITYDKENTPLYYMCEPCDAAFEALRSAMEAHVPAWCIDLDVDFYPDIHEVLPDPYALQRIGLKNYYDAYRKIILNKGVIKIKSDKDRETYMAKRLKELSLQYDRVLFVGGMSHIESVLEKVKQQAFPSLVHAEREAIELCTLSELSARDVMAECGWIASHYEHLRSSDVSYADENPFPPDRQKLIFKLYKEASVKYVKNSGAPFPGYHMRNLMKFLRNYALKTDRLMPSLYQILATAKGCVDHNYAYEVWELATEYPFLKNIDNLPELDLAIEDVWGESKLLKFHMKTQNPKSRLAQRRKKDSSKVTIRPPGPFAICSYPPEDVVVEKFGEFLKKKGSQITLEENARTIPFTTSLEDGIDTRETIRHWHEKKLYVKAQGKPQGGVGSVVIIFDEEEPLEGKPQPSKYPWTVTWLGENEQESDMSFYATPATKHVIGPGISRCEYGGFMMTYPPRRLYDVWTDPDYADCRSKAETLLMAAIDYSVQPLITYVAAKPPRSALKSYARRFGKKVVYLPLGQLSPVTLAKLRLFHVLDSKDKRAIAGEYIERD